MLNQLGVKPAVGRKRHAKSARTGLSLPPALWERTAHRRAIGMRRAFRSVSAPDAESWFSRAPTALHAPTETHQHTLHLRYTVTTSLYVHCRGSRGRAFSLSRTANTSFSSAPRVRVQ